MGFAHGYHHDKDGVGFTAEDEFAMSLCFCESCLARAKKAGVDGEAARRIVAQWIVEACERAAPKPRFPDFPSAGVEAFRAFPAVHEYLIWRTEPVTSLVAEIKARAHGQSRVVLIDEGSLGGCDLSAIGKICDGAILCVYGLGAEEGAAVIKAGRAALGPEKFLSAGFRLFNGEVGGADGLARSRRRLRRGRSERAQFLQLRPRSGAAPRLDPRRRQRPLRALTRPPRAARLPRRRPAPRAFSLRPGRRPAPCRGARRRPCRRAPPSRAAPARPR